MNTKYLSAHAGVAVMVAIAGWGCAASQPRNDSAARPQPSQPADPQAAYEPRSAPGEGQQFLARMAGEWDVVKTFYPRCGPAVATRGTCVQHMIHGGRFLQSDFTFDDATAKTTGTGIIGFDPQTGEFTSTWVDSRSTRFSIRQSEGAFDGAQIILFSRTIGPAGADARRSRTVSTLEDHDRRLIHRQSSIAADGSERPVMQLEMIRKR